MKNLILVVLKKHISKNEFSYISDLLKTSDLKKDILSFEINSKKKIFLVSIKKRYKNIRYRKFGSKII